MYNVYPYSTVHGTIALHSARHQSNSHGRINNDRAWKESTTMHHPMLVLDSHVQAVTTNRLQKARMAEQIRLATAGQPGLVSRAVTSVRRVVGEALIGLGTRLHQEPGACGMDTMPVTPSRSISS